MFGRRKIFQPLAIRLQSMSRRIIRNYYAPTAPRTAPNELPPAWSQQQQEPLLWRQTDSPPAAAPAPTPAPAAPPAAAPEEAPLDQGLLNILAAHEARRGKPPKSVQRQPENTPPAEKPASLTAGNPERRRGRMGVDYVETTALRQEAPGTAPRPALKARPPRAKRPMPMRRR
ncbi:MAG: hypothetical protein MUE40_08145 [Anaerolineae bacterium]|nr:hypothetical protein [Anaerolineae bacterium]